MIEGWPHQFVQNGAPDEVKQKDMFGDDVVVKHTPMICIHCKTTFVTNKSPQPLSSCPARNDKHEIDRITRRKPLRR